MDGFATLHQLQNAPAGTMFRERRGAPLEGITLGGQPTQAEYRTAGHAANPQGLAYLPRTFEQRIRQLEAELTEPFEG